MGVTEAGQLGESKQLWVRQGLCDSRGEITCQSCGAGVVVDTALSHLYTLSNAQTRAYCPQCDDVDKEREEALRAWDARAALDREAK